MIKFYLLLISCLLWQILPAHSQTVPCNAATSQTTNISGLCIGCYVNNPVFATDSSPATFSTLRVTLGILGGYVEQRLNFSTISQLGDSARIFLSFPVGLLDLSLLGSIQVATYNGAVYNNDRKSINGGLLNIRLLAADQILVSWAPARFFNSVEVRLNSGLQQLLNTVNIGYAYKVVPSPVITPAITSVCSGQSVQLNATAPASAIFRWYTQSSGGAAIATGNTLNVQALNGNLLYYAQAERGGCINPVRTVATINGRMLPVAPLVQATTDSVCRNEKAIFTVVKLPGVNYSWYNQATGGNLLAADTTFFTPPLTTQTNYYVAAKDSTGCISASRTMVTAAIRPPGPGISMGSRNSLGGSGDDRFTAIAPTIYGGYITGGTTTSNDGDITGGNHGLTDWWIVKLNAAGNKIWSKTFGTTGKDSLTTITAADDEKLIACGNYNVQSTSQTGQILGLDNSGSILWSKQTDLYNQYASIDPFRQNAAIIIGSNGTKIKLTELNTAGNIIRTAEYVGNYATERISFVITDDKGLLIAGSTGSGIGYGKDIFLLKLDSNLNRKWEKNILQSGDDIGVRLSREANNSFIVSSTNDIGTGGQQVQIIKLDSLGNIVFLKTLNPKDFMSQDVNKSGSTGVASDLDEYESTMVINQNGGSYARAPIGGIDEGKSNTSQGKGPSRTRVAGPRFIFYSAARLTGNTDSIVNISMLFELDDNGNIVAQQAQATPLIPGDAVPNPDGSAFIAGASPALNGNAQLAQVAPPSCLPANLPLLAKEGKTAGQYRELLSSTSKQAGNNPAFQIFPNPFNQTFTCRYEVLQKERIQLRLIPVNGTGNYLIKNEITEPGIYNIQIDARRYNTGTYILQLQLGSKKRTLKLIKQ
ncbi:MAG TPA: T9SS type A sorting domain-containing protein [Chitinophaga sp.]|uniref:Ig-like domain-containing protein n=1 Tax=Chitinophaga sp. TaxID=1869181 RepID=UPI002BB8675C|nr:T9SS type A sorting domain-containing protein [Chitinophaga sp.]HVI49204.1 T9SS type A sorting domain-containing protein [Chitinophaga sp.]